MAKLPGKDANCLHTMPDGIVYANQLEAQVWMTGAYSAIDGEPRDNSHACFGLTNKKKDIWDAGWDYAAFRIGMCKFIEQIFDVKEKKVIL